MNKLYSPIKLNLNSPSESVSVMSESQIAVGSIEIHEVLKMLNQDGKILFHKFKRLVKGQVVEKAYKFDRSYVIEFIKKYIPTNHDFLSVSDAEWVEILRGKYTNI